MKIGLIDLDNTEKFPNLALMKISSYYKSKGHQVEWYQQVLNVEYDIVYVSKVFSWSKDYQYPIHSKKVIYGGVAYGYDNKLPYEIEHSCPDYSVYPYLKNTAYGFLTRGCPRGCSFCNVQAHQGNISKKVSDLKEFWNGEREIKLLDPNILACKDWKELFQQLVDSNAWIDFTQGLDIRLLTKEMADYLNKMKIKQIHFAWDQYEMKSFDKLKEVRKWLNFDSRKLRVYLLVNYNTTFEQDLDRIMKLRYLEYSPYVMRFKDYNCQNPKLPLGNIYNKLARWCNNVALWRSNNTFEEYLEKSCVIEK